MSDDNDRKNAEPESVRITGIRALTAAEVDRVIAEAAGSPHSNFEDRMSRSKSSGRR